MKIKHTLLSLLMLLVSSTIFSCGKVSETLERDVIVRPDEINFDIAKVTNTQSGTKFAEIPVTMNFDTLIRNQTKQEMGIQNAKNFSVTSFQLVIESLKDDNNFGNFETINVYIESDTQPKTLVANLIGNPSSKNGRVTIPILENRPELRGFLSSSAFKFILEGKARNPTTIVLNVDAIISYSLKVGR